MNFNYDASKFNKIYEKKGHKIEPSFGAIGNMGAGVVGGVLGFGLTEQFTQTQPSLGPLFTGLPVFTAFPAPLPDGATAELEAIGKATSVKGLHGSVIDSLYGTGVEVSSPMLGAGLGAVLHLQKNAEGLQASLRNSDGTITPLPAKSSGPVVEVELGNDRQFHIYSSSDTERLYVSSHKASLAVDLKDGAASHVGINKHGTDHNGVLAWNEGYTGFLSPNGNLTELQNLAHDFTDKKK